MLAHHGSSYFHRYRYRLTNEDCSISCCVHHLVDIKLTNQTQKVKTK